MPKAKKPRISTPAIRRSSRYHILKNNSDGTAIHSNWWTDLSDKSIRRSSIANRKSHLNILTTDSVNFTKNPEFWKDLSQDESGLANAIKNSGKKISDNYEESENISDVKVEEKQLFTKRNATHRFSNAFTRSENTDEEAQPEQEQKERPIEEKKKETRIEKAGPSKQNRAKKKKSIFSRKTKEKPRFSDAFASMRQEENEASDIEISGNEAEKPKTKKLFTKSKNTRKYAEALSETSDEEVQLEEKQKEANIGEAGSSKLNRSKKKKSVFSRNTKEKPRFSAAFASTHKEDSDIENEESDIEISGKEAENPRTKKLFIKSKNRQKYSKTLSETRAEEVQPEEKQEETNIEEPGPFKLDGTKKKSIFVRKTKEKPRFSAAFASTHKEESDIENEASESTDEEVLQETNIDEEGPLKLDKTKKKSIFVRETKEKPKFSGAFVSTHKEESDIENEALSIEISGNEDENAEIATENPIRKKLFNKPKHSRKFSEAFADYETTGEEMQPEEEQEETNIEEAGSLKLDKSKKKSMFARETKEKHRFSAAFASTHKDENEASDIEISGNEEANLNLKSKNPRGDSEAFLKTATEQLQNKSGLQSFQADTKMPNSKQLFKAKNVRKSSKVATAELTENNSEPETNSKEVRKSSKIDQISSKKLEQIIVNKKKDEVLLNMSISSNDEEVADLLLKNIKKVETRSFSEVGKRVPSTVDLQENYMSDSIIQSKISLTKDKGFETTAEQNKQSFKNKSKELHKYSKPNIQNILRDSSLETSGKIQNVRKISDVFTETEQTEMIEPNKSTVRNYSDAFSADEPDKSLTDTEINLNKRSRKNETEFKTISSINDSSEPDKPLVFRSSVRKNLFSKTESSKALETIRSKRLSSASNSFSSKFFDTSLISSTKILNITSGKALSEYTPGKKLRDSEGPSRKSGSLPPIIESPSFQFKHPNRRRRITNEPIMEQEQKTKKLRNSTTEKLVSIFDEQSRHSQEHASNKEASINKSRYVKKTKIDETTRREIIITETENDEIPVIKSKQNKLFGKTKSSDVGEPGQATSFSEISLKSQNTKQNKPPKKTSTSEVGSLKQVTQSPKVPDIETERDESLIINTKKILFKKTNSTSEVGSIRQETRVSKMPDIETERDNSLIINSKNTKQNKPSKKISTSEVGSIVQDTNSIENEKSASDVWSLSIAGSNSDNNDTNEKQPDIPQPTKRGTRSKNKQIEEESSAENDRGHSSHDEAHAEIELGIASQNTESGPESRENKKSQDSIRVSKPLDLHKQSEELESWVQSEDSRKSDDIANLTENKQTEKQPNNKTISNELESFHVAEDLIINKLMNKPKLTYDKSSSNQSILAAYFSPEKDSLEKEKEPVDEKRKKYLEQQNVFLKLFAQAEPTSKKNRINVNTGKKGYTFPTLHKYGVPQKPKTVKPIESAKLVNGKIYKPTKLFKGAKWCNGRFYKFLQDKIQDKYNERTVVESENLMKHIYSSMRIIDKSKKYMAQEVNQLTKELARNGVIETTFDFYRFVEHYLPFECRVKIIPCRQAYTSETFAPYKRGQLFEKIKF